MTGVWGADDQWLVTFDEPVELFGGAADSFAYEIRQLGNTNETLPVLGATLQPNGREVILVTAVSRVLGRLYTYTTLQPIDDACAGNPTASGMTGLVFLQNAILDYGDFRLWRYSDDAKDYGADWRASAFDDSQWSSGRQLFHRTRGNLEATMVAGQAVGTFLELTNFTANPPTNLTTVYLRSKLFIPFSTVQLTGFPIYDDGFILYVNGVEVYRANVAAAADQWTNYSGGATIDAGFPSYTLPFEIPMSAVTVGTENTIAVMLKQVNGTSADLTFGLRIVATVRDFVVDPVVFIELPVPTTVTEGHLLTLRVRASGTSPSYQWYRQRVPIPGATSEVYAKVAELSDAGEYRLDVRGFAGSLQSSPSVPVTVRPVVIPYGLVWRYSTNSQNATLSTTPWYTPAFDDLSWAAGSGPFGYDVSAATLARLPAPLATLLPPPNASFLTTYFRTTVEIPPLPAGSTVALFHLVDDGAIFYVDGIRRLNYNGPSTNPTLSEDLAPGVAPGNGDAMMVAVPLTLTPGLHTFAVEVHQNSPTSSDVIFGAELRIIDDAIAPALTITRSATGGVQLSWPGNPIYSLYEAAAIAGPFTPVANDPQGTYLVADPRFDSNIFFQLRLNGR